MRGYLLAGLFFATSGIANATVYSNTFSGEYIGSLSQNGSSSYGQVFNTAGGTLTDWSFFADSGFAGNLRFSIAGWDNVTKSTTSSLYSTTSSYNGGVETLSFSNINTTLAAGSYIAIVDVFNNASTANDLSFSASLGDGGLGGLFYFTLDNPLLASTQWNEYRYRDTGQPQSLLFSATINAAAPTAAVPEPETYAMFLAGLGLMGFASRRRKAA